MGTDSMPDWLEALASMDDSAARNQFVSGHAAALPMDAPAMIHSGVLAALNSDRQRASRLSHAARGLAETRGDELSRAWSARIEGHCQYVDGNYEQAVADYERAASLFESAGAEAELARTLLGALQALIFRGGYERAHQWAGRAEAIFRCCDDRLRLARLDLNVGNIYFRQDRPKDALSRYQRALEGFERTGEARDTAAALSNLAVSSTSLGYFQDALSYYQRAREHCRKHDFDNLAARADYNIAYLHYLRGDYREARELYEAAREHSEASGDRYHAALCDLDQAEMNLDVNLTREGEMLARRAEQGFASLGMSYERGKALVSLAVAASQRRDYCDADRRLIEARRVFVKEKNPVWPAMVDQLRAVVAFHQGRFERARRLGASAWRALTRTMVTGRAAHCQILLARLWLRADQPDRARAISEEAVERVGTDVSPSLRFHARLVQGEIHEAEGRRQEALQAYEAARHEVEELRSRVDSEDLRISILKDKLAVYEAMVALCLDSPDGAERAMLLVQQAKSRIMADRLNELAESNEAGAGHETAAALRTELNVVYRQMDLATVSAGGHGGRLTALRERARELEAQVVERKSRFGPRMSSALTPPEDLAALQQTLHEGELLLEYYEARGQLWVFLLSRRGLEVSPLGPSSPARQALKLLQFQIGRFRRLKESPFPMDADAVSYHLNELYQLLLAPLEGHLSGHRHLILSPHRDFHALPFAALHNGKQSLVDRFTLSAIPSAGVLARVRSRSRPDTRGSVVIAAPDRRAPRIQEEARAVADLLGDARLLVGGDASIEAFRRYGPGSRIVHLAGHGVFRRDNPMFSSLQLADGQLSILELNHLALNVDLLTLSACSTGLTVAVGGDELLGLMRGCLQAGARSVLVTLWEIDDASTKEFMRRFYRSAEAGKSLAAALQGAMQEIREEFGHPYFWAPFLLVGEPGAIGATSGR